MIICLTAMGVSKTLRKYIHHSILIMSIFYILFYNMSDFYLLPRTPAFGIIGTYIIIKMNRDVK